MKAEPIVIRVTVILSYDRPYSIGLTAAQLRTACERRARRQGWPEGTPAAIREFKKAAACEYARRTYR